jgi:hypothetical protein
MARLAEHFIVDDHRGVCGEHQQFAGCSSLRARETFDVGAGAFARVNRLVEICRANLEGDTEVPQKFTPAG